MNNNTNNTHEDNVIPFRKYKPLTDPVKQKALEIMRNAKKVAQESLQPVMQRQKAFRIRTR